MLQLPMLSACSIGWPLCSHPGPRCKYRTKCIYVSCLHKYTWFCIYTRDRDSLMQYIYKQQQDVQLPISFEFHEKLYTELFVFAAKEDNFMYLITRFSVQIHQ